MIHTRVPESLEVELRQRADDLGISVSNLVRNVLGHAFGRVGDVAIDDVLGWQPMVLGKNTACARCNDLLPRGSDAAIGIAEASGSRLAICLVCVGQLRA